MKFKQRSLNLTGRILLGLILLTSLASVVTFAQDRASTGSDYIIFVSARTGNSELFAMNLNDLSVSQLTNTGRSHITPFVATGAQVATFASREGSSYEIFSADVSASWRSNRPMFATVNRLTVNTIEETNPTLTTDGSKMSFSANGAITMMDSSGDNRREVVPADGFLNVAPSISPDGKFIAFLSNRDGANEVWTVNTATSELKQITHGGAVIGGISWTPDEKRIVFTTTATTSKLTGIAMADVASGSVTVLTESGDGEAAVSPDGSRIVFTSTRSGDPELYLLNLNTNSLKRLTYEAGPDGTATFVSPAVDSIRRNAPSRQGLTRSRN